MTGLKPLCRTKSQHPGRCCPAEQNETDNLFSSFILSASFILISATFFPTASRVLRSSIQSLQFDICSWDGHVLDLHRIIFYDYLILTSPFGFHLSSRERRLLLAKPNSGSGRHSMLLRFRLLPFRLQSMLRYELDLSIRRCLPETIRQLPILLPRYMFRQGLGISGLSFILSWPKCVWSTMGPESS